MDPSMVLAQPADRDIIIDMMEESCLWLQSRGEAHWTPGMLRDKPWLVGDRIEEGTVYLLRLEGAVAGTITLQSDDEEVWGEQPAIALYVLGLTTARTFGGRGLGRWMLEWAAERTRAANLPLLRLDCTAKNRKLCRYYEDAGFRFVGTTAMGPEDVRALYQKPVAVG